MNDVFDPVFSLEVPPAFHEFTNFAEVIRWRAAAHPDAIAYTFLADGEDDAEDITFGELDRYVQNVAATIRSAAQPGDRALLIYDSGIEYIGAILGCFAAGVIAVPVYPPDPWRFQTTLERLEVVLADCDASVLLTTNQFLQAAEDLRTRCAALKEVIPTDTIPRHGSGAVQLTSTTPDTPALLQYTSGSTGTPKGVIVSHGNLLFNARHIQRFDEPHAVAVSWLPMYHDMGLMGTVLQAVHSGRRLVLMSPMRFVERPFRWLRAISKYRAYSTCGPNFAFDLCVRKIPEDDLATLDLSCLSLAVTGAEPIRPDTLDRFAKRFAPCGFNRQAFYPSFGMAEATLIVSGGGKYDLPIIKAHNTNGHRPNAQVTAAPNSAQQQRALVGCGRAIDQVEVKIVDPETRRLCPAGTIGEIWVAGPGVAQGYWNRPQETQETFGGFLSDDSTGPFLRTGDLGFLDGDELFVAGRIKDTIILRGHNYYPQDIERTVEQCDRHLDNQVGVAFCIDQGDQERLVLVQEVRRTKKLNPAKILAAVRGSIQQEHQIQPAAVVLVPRGAVPKTSSGKVRRAVCKTQYLDKTLEIIAEWSDRQPAQPLAVSTTANNGQPTSDNQVAADTWQASLDSHRREILEFLGQAMRELDHCQLPDRLHGEMLLFADLGLESIDAVELLAKIESHYGRQIPFDEFFAEIGQRKSRDVAIGELLDFLDLKLPDRPDDKSAAAGTRSIAQVGDLQMFYRQEGDSGPDVVLIHGVGGNLTGWYLCGLVRELAKNFRVTTYDLRGHGRTDVPPSGYTSQSLARDLVGLLDELQIERPFLMGHSYGATVAMHAAVEHPQRVAGIVLSDAYLPGLRDVHGAVDGWLGWERYQELAEEVGLDVSGDWDNLEPLFEQVAQLEPEQQQRFIEIADLSTLHRLAQLAMTSCGRDVKSTKGMTAAEILAVKHPVVCLFGDRSPFRRLSDYLAEKLPNCEEAIVPATEHFGFDENPAEYVRLAVRSLARLARLDIDEATLDIPTGQRHRRTIFVDDRSTNGNHNGEKILKRATAGRPATHETRSYTEGH